MGEEKNPVGAGTGIWKLPKSSGPQWSADVIRRFHVMKEDKIDEYVAANFDNFWKKYDNNGTGALSDMDSAGQLIQNEFSKDGAVSPFYHRYNIAAPKEYQAYPVSNPSAAPE